MTNANNAFSHADYQIAQRDVVFDDYLRVVKYHFKIRLYNGNWSDTIIRKVVERDPAVSILPYDPRRDEVILVEQFRAGALLNEQSPWIIETIAGMCEHKTEPRDQVAIREASEEAGCKILDIYQICEYFVSPGGNNEFMTLFCGHADTTNAGGIFGLKVEHEDIRAMVFSFSEAFQLIEKGKIRTAPTMISLYWLQQNRERLKKLWLTK